MNTATLHLFQCKSVTFSSVLNHSWWWWKLYNCYRVWLQTNSWLVKTSSQCWSLQCVQLPSIYHRWVHMHLPIHKRDWKEVYVTKPPGHQMVVQSTVSGLLLHTKHCTHSCDMLAQRTVILTLKNQLKENGVRMLQLRHPRHAVQSICMWKHDNHVYIMCMANVCSSIAQYCTMQNPTQCSNHIVAQSCRKLNYYWDATQPLLASKWQNNPLL